MPANDKGFALGFDCLTATGVHFNQFSLKGDVFQ